MLIANKVVRSFIVHYLPGVITAKWRKRLSLALTVSLILASFNMLAGGAYGAGLTASSLSLSDPRPDATAASVTYTFKWTASTTATLRCLTYQVKTSPAEAVNTVPTGFSNASATNGSFTNLAGTWTIDNTTSGTVKNTNATGTSVSSGTAVTTPINAITNPTNSAGEVNYVKIVTYDDAGCTSAVDSRVIAFTTTPGVFVSATVDSTLSFTVTGVAASTTYKGALATASNCIDTATAVTFGTAGSRLAANTNYDCAQNLSTSTNATNGYQVLITGRQTSGDFLKMNGNTSNTITNWTGTNGTPTATPVSGTTDEVFAYTTNDSSLSGTATRFTASDNLFAGLTTTGDEVAYASGPVSGDSVNVGLRLRFTGVTEAGTYEGTLTYTCTPVF
jgi:hypothetical protein